MALQLGSCRLYQILLLEGYRPDWVFLIEKHNLYPNHLLGSWCSGWTSRSSPQIQKKASGIAFVSLGAQGVAILWAGGLVVDVPSADQSYQPNWS